MSTFTCYDGNMMILPGWSKPVIINTMGIEIPYTVPLMVYRNKILTNVKVWRTDDGTLEFDLPKDVKLPCFVYAYTIGADVDETETVTKSFININEKTFDINKKGVYVIQKSRLRKISIVEAQDARKIELNCNKSQDNVNHPIHYTSHPSGIECIGITKYYDFCIGNAIKYLWRAGLKHEEGMDDKTKQIEDLKKAIFYINQIITMLEGK